MARAGSKPAAISAEAHRALKLCAVLTGREMYDLASEAILRYARDECAKTPRSLSEVLRPRKKAR